MAGPPMYQTAPYPEVLAELVEQLEYRHDWSFSLESIDRGQGSEGLTLSIVVTTVNSYPPHHPMRVRHLMPVPPAAYSRASWQRWLFDQIVLVERHEAMEFFTINGHKPFAPNHGPGEDPYSVRELTTDEDRRTSFRGDVKHPEG